MIVMRDRGRVRIDKSDKSVAAKRCDVKMNTLTGVGVTTVSDAVTITVENREI